MTHRNDAAAADVLGRWRMLAEQRLEYLTQLFESGRWRRYYGEREFLENIREAKFAVETWRDLSAADGAPENAIRMTWLASETPRRLPRIERAPTIAAAPIEVALETKAAPAHHAPAAADALAVEQALEAVEQVLDLSAIEQRYPLLRNTL